MFAIQWLDECIWFKTHELCFIRDHVETNTSWMIAPGQVAEIRLELVICKMCLIITVVCVSDSFHGYHLVILSYGQNLNTGEVKLRENKICSLHNHLVILLRIDTW